VAEGKVGFQPLDNLSGFEALIQCARLKLNDFMELSPKYTGLQTIGWLA
jgi:hypothetical protein